MARQAILPDGLKTKSQLMGSLPSAVDLVGTPGKVVLSLEGGTHKDFAIAEQYLQSQMMAWQIVHSEEVTTYYEAVIRGLEQCQSTLVAIIPAWIEVTDKQWVQRMIWPMGRDRTALLCGTWVEQGPAKDLAPHLVTPRTWPGGGFFVGRRNEVYENLRLCMEGEMHDALAKAASMNGWRLWAHPGVRFNKHDHEPHERKTIGQEAGATPAGSNS